MAPVSITHSQKRNDDFTVKLIKNGIQKALLKF